MMEHSNVDYLLINDIAAIEILKKCTHFHQVAICFCNKK